MNAIWSGHQTLNKCANIKIDWMEILAVGPKYKFKIYPWPWHRPSPLLGLCICDWCIFRCRIQSWETTWEASRQSTLYNQHWTQRIHVGNDKKDLKTFAKLCGQWYVCQTLLVVVSHLMKSRTLWRPMSTLAALFHTFPHYSTLCFNHPMSPPATTMCLLHYSDGGCGGADLNHHTYPFCKITLFYPRPWSKKARIGYKNTQLL